jgi:hypothetical protein
VSGVLVMKRREASEGLLEDERDRAIDRHAAKTAYFLLTGMIVVGMVMPFNKSGWEVVNTTFARRHHRARGRRAGPCSEGGPATAHCGV